MAVLADRSAVTRTLFRTNDMVQVISGRDGGRVTAPADGERGSARPQGKRGRVRSINRAKGRLVVEGANIIHRHERPDPAKGRRGGRVDVEGTVAIASVRLVCPGCDRAVRVRRGRDDKGRLVRVCSKCSATF
jgi:large subunit ribosomal protein L24